MYKLNVVSARFYEVQLPGGKVLHLEQPKLKVLRKIEDSGESVQELAESVSMILSKNREHVKISPAEVMEMLDLDQCSDFLDDFTDWLTGQKAADPN